jgi:aspartyl/glutamyl-tRNA(Asn/Gln) amidotransferase C subunit
MDNEELRITAELAHLNLTEQELSSAHIAFEQMLKYFEAMRSADSLISEQENVVNKFNAKPAMFRADSAENESDGRLQNEIVELAAEHDGRFIIIPNVL